MIVPCSGLIFGQTSVVHLLLVNSRTDCDLRYITSERDKEETIAHKVPLHGHVMQRPVRNGATFTDGTLPTFKRSNDMCN